MTDDEIPSRFQRKACWAALTGISILVIVALVCALVYGLGRMFVAFEAVLLPIIIAGLLSYLLLPIVGWVEKYVKKRIAAVLIVMVVAAVGVTGFGYALIPPLVEQTTILVEHRQEILTNATDTGREILDSNPYAQQVVDTLYAKAKKQAEQEASATVPENYQLADNDYVGKAAAVIDYNSSYVVDKAISWLVAGTRAAYGAISFLIGLVMVPVFLFYFMLESENISQNWHTILPLRHSDFREEVVETLKQINGYIIAFIRGQMLVSLIDGFLLGIALKILGLPYAITIACSAALLGVIPYIGMISTSIPAMLIAWFTWHDFTHVAIVAAIFMGVSQLDGWVIQPKVVGNRVGMHDMTVMFSVLFWSLVLGGVVGALLAVPLTASIKVIFMRYVWSSLRKNADRASAPGADKHAADKAGDGSEPGGGAKSKHRRRRRKHAGSTAAVAD